MKFCSKCDSALSPTSEGLKCRKCDDINPNPALTTQQIENTLLTDKEFPYVQGSCYIQQSIRDHFRLPMMRGINVKKNIGMVILFRNIPKKTSRSSSSQSNVYSDKFDKESGIYHYTGEGMTGDQTMSGRNDSLKNAKTYGFDIHLFWQHSEDSDHEYVGKVNVQEVSTEKQPGQNDAMRDVFVFSLKLEETI